MKNQALLSSKDKSKKNKNFNCFSEKIRLDISSESSARQRIHMKSQALLSSKDKSKKLKCHLLQFLFGALRVNWNFNAFPFPAFFSLKFLPYLIEFLQVVEKIIP